MTILLLIDAYLLGSIPFGLIVTLLAGYGDIRNVGSGNIGATNVLRSGHKLLAALTLLLDTGKGWFAVWLTAHFTFIAGGSIFYAYLFTPLAVTIGHCYPIWLKFKGGKGVATALGAMLGFMHPLMGGALVAIWCVIFALSRISSLSALIAFGALPYIGITYFHAPLVTTLPVSLLIFWRHRSNIKRLLTGTEHRFGKKSAA